MRAMNRRTWLFGAVLLAGCATWQKENFVKEQAGVYVYEMPVEQVWPQARAMLTEQGYTYRELPGRFLAVTEWKEENGSSEMGASFSRYMVEGQKIDDTHCRVRFLRNTMLSAPTGDMAMTSTERHAAQSTAAANAAAQGTAGRAGPAATAQGRAGRTATAAEGVRDLHAEWLLMQRVVPEDAEEIQDEADRRFK